MNPSALDFLCCPRCQHELSLHPTKDSASTHVIEGSLGCTACASSFPIRGGIPRFVPTERYAASFGFQWNRFRRTQLDSYTGLPLSRNRLFRATGWPEDLSGDVVLEVGSGAGRFTEVLLATGATVFSSDLSTAIEANGLNNGGSTRLHLAQADLHDLPFAKGRFDRVLCLGVLQHTPNPRRAFHCLLEYLRPGGHIAVDVYDGRLIALLPWKYLLRPITIRLPQRRLLSLVERAVHLLLPGAVLARRLAGPLGSRLFPILSYHHLGLPTDINREWSILDTFDMYSPTHDHPQSLDTVRSWVEAEGLRDCLVEYGPNGIVVRGKARSLTRQNPTLESG
ncbi:MAG: methyltransferase domain-containing protein [Myxococcales bacterium]|nr:methyltransferase domain-containing protein [Myxococcales bacterium]